MANFSLQNRDVSDTNLAALGEVTAKGGLIVRFKHVRIEANGRLIDRLVVEQQPRGDRSTVATRYITEEQAREMFPEQYRRFAESGGKLTNGTPLSEIPGMTNSYLGRLQLHGLMSVEDLLATNMSQLQQIGRDAVAAYELAADWSQGRDMAQEHIQRAGDTAELLDRATTAEEKAAELEKKLAEAEMKLQVLDKVTGRAPAADDNRPRIRPDEPDDLGDINDDDAFLTSGQDVLNSDPNPLED